jgi:hypothetical protein
MASLFTVTNPWSQPRCLTMDDWIKKIWYIYTMGNYSDIKKNEIMPLVGKWMELEVIMLSQIRQTQKDKNYMFSLICGI